MKSHFSPLIKAEQKLLKLAAIISAQGKYAEHNKELRKHKRADKTEYFQGLKGEQYYGQYKHLNWINTRYLAEFWEQKMYLQTVE